MKSKLTRNLDLYLAATDNFCNYPKGAVLSSHGFFFRSSAHTYTHAGWYLQKTVFWISAPQQESQEVQSVVRWEGSSGKTERSILAVLPGQETVLGKKKIKIKLYEHEESRKLDRILSYTNLSTNNIKLVTSMFSKEIDM